MVNIILDPNFEKKFKKLKDKSLKGKIVRQISKIKNIPKIGKPMMYGRKGTREVYVSPYRISYMIKSKDLIYILDFYHKDEQ
jgi:mRNA-degrading endonuclease RelE of RelBE toxin-antitoxin system